MIDYTHLDYQANNTLLTVHKTGNQCWKKLTHLLLLTRESVHERSRHPLLTQVRASPPPPLKRMTTEFVNNLLTALGDERICNRLGDIISASLRQKVEDQEKSIQVLEQKVAELENKQRILDAKADEQEK